MNQYDKLKIEHLGITRPLDADEQGWLDTVYVPQLLESFEQIEDGLFSPKLTFHTMVTSDLYFTAGIGDTTIAEAFTNWYFDRPGTTYLIEQ
jgi:hypothetical protein